MSDLTDNKFYPSAEGIWSCIRLNNAGKWACDRLTEDADLGKKKIIFTDEAHFDFGFVICDLIWAQKTRTHTLKSHPKRVIV